MSRAFVTSLALTVFMAGTATAQPPVETTPRAQPPRPAPVAQEKPRAPAASQEKPRPAEAAPREPGQPVNVKIDLLITDQAGPGAPAKRTVTMIVADRQHGSIRSLGNQIQARMYVDANPRLLPNGNIQLLLGLEYNPRQPSNEEPAPEGSVIIQPSPAPIGGSSLNQRITLILQPGKPLVISQAADPVTERKITVEVSATILK